MLRPNSLFLQRTDLRISLFRAKFDTVRNRAFQLHVWHMPVTTQCFYSVIAPPPSENLGWPEERFPYVLPSRHLLPALQRSQHQHLPSRVFYKSAGPCCFPLRNQASETQQNFVTQIGDLSILQFHVEMLVFIRSNFDEIDFTTF